MNKITNIMFPDNGIVQNIYKPAISAVLDLSDYTESSRKPFVYILPNSTGTYMNTDVLEEAKHLVNYISNVNMVLDINNYDIFSTLENDKSFDYFIEHTIAKDITVWLMCTSSNFMDFLVDTVYKYCEKYDTTMGVCVPLQSSCFNENILLCKSKKIPILIYNNLFINENKITDESLCENILFTKKFCKYMTIYWLLEPVNLEKYPNFKKYIVKYSEKVLVSTKNKIAMARYNNQNITVHPMCIIGDIVSYYISLLKCCV